MTEKIIELLRESSLVQGVVALVTTGGMVYMYAAQIPVPDVLIGIVTMILGFYFGGKVKDAQYHRKE